MLRNLTWINCLFEVLGHPSKSDCSHPDNIRHVNFVHWSFLCHQGLWGKGTHRITRLHSHKLPRFRYYARLEIGWTSEQCLLTSHQTFDATLEVHGWNFVPAPQLDPDGIPLQSFACGFWKTQSPCLHMAVSSLAQLQITTQLPHAKDPWLGSQNISYDATWHSQEMASSLFQQPTAEAPRDTYIACLF